MIDVGGVGAPRRGRAELRRRRRGRPARTTTRASSRELQRARDASPPSCASGSPPRRSATSPPTTPRSPRYLNHIAGITFPEPADARPREGRDLRYGENPHQRAAFYRETTHRTGTLADATQLQGEPPTLQQPARPRRRVPDRARLHGADRAHRQAHATRSASPRNDELVEAYRKALEGDPVARSAAIVGVNRQLDGATAREIAANSYEAVVAPGVQRGRARRCCGRRPSLEILAVPPDPTEGLRDYGIADLDFKRIAGGLLVETHDELGLDRAQLQVVTKRRPTLEELTDLLFAWRAVRHVRARTRSCSRGTRATVGVGAGQASRLVVGRDRAAPGRRPRQARGHGLRRLLPVPRRHPARRRARASRRSSSRAAPSATRWPSRSPTATTWRWSSPAAATSATDAAPSPERTRSPSSAASERHGDSCSRWRWSASPRPPRSHRRASWAAATGTGPTAPPPRPCAGRWTRSRSPGTIVIGEGERDEAPMLYIGEQRRAARRADAARRRKSTSRSTRSRARTSSPHGQANAITVLAASEKGGLLNAPDTYLEKLCVGPGRGGPRRHPRCRRPRTCDRIAAALGRGVSDITVVILDRPRHDDADRRGPRRPARASSSSPTATCRPPSAARSRAPASMR